MKQLFERIRQIKANLHKEVHLSLDSGINLELRDERISSFGGIFRNNKYNQCRIPEDLARDCGFSSGDELLLFNYNHINNFLRNNFGDFSYDERKEVERVKELFTSLPMLHVTQAEPFEIACYQGLISYEKYARVVGDSINHNTTESDLRTGRGKFVYLSLGNAYIGGNNSRLHDITVITVNGKQLKDPHFVVQANAFNKLDGLFENAQISQEKAQSEYHYLNRTTLLGEDFLQLASMALVKNALSYRDFDRSEVMIRDELPVGYISDIVRSVSESEDQMPDRSRSEVVCTNGESVSYSGITVKELCNMQFLLTSEETFWNPHLKNR